MLPKALHSSHQAISIQSVACFKDSAVELEYAVVLKGEDKLEALGATQCSDEECLIQLESQFRKHRQIFEETEQQIAAKTQESKNLDSNVKGQTKTVDELRNEVYTLKPIEVPLRCFMIRSMISAHLMMSDWPMFAKKISQNCWLHFIFMTGSYQK